MADDALELLAQFTRAAVDKVLAETAADTWKPCTVFGFDDSSDAFLHALVHVDGDPAGLISTIPVATGSGLATGARAVVVYTAPCGAWVIGGPFSPSTSDTLPPAVLDHVGHMVATASFEGAFDGEDTFTIDIPAGSHSITLVMNSTPTMTPLGMDIAWTASGPGSFSDSASGLGPNVVTAGPTSFPSMPGGTYTVVVSVSAFIENFISGAFDYTFTVA